jgi:hypothetical protein
MSHKGFSHIGLSTLDLDKTREFYEGVLGFKPVRCDTITVKEGGKIRHIFFDTGRDQLLAFMEARGVPGVPAEYDAGINRALGLPSAFYHFAFETGACRGSNRNVPNCSPRASRSAKSWITTGPNPSTSRILTECNSSIAAIRASLTTMTRACRIASRPRLKGWASTSKSTSHRKSSSPSKPADSPT